MKDLISQSEPLRVEGRVKDAALDLDASLEEHIIMIDSRGQLPSKGLTP